MTPPKAASTSHLRSPCHSFLLVLALLVVDDYVWKFGHCVQCTHWSCIWITQLKKVSCTRIVFLLFECELCFWASMILKNKRIFSLNCLRKLHFMIVKIIYIVWMAAQDRPCCWKNHRFHPILQGWDHELFWILLKWLFLGSHEISDSQKFLSSGEDLCINRKFPF